MARRTARSKIRKGRRWSRRVTETSNAMDLPPGIFKRQPKQIARGLKQSVERSRRTKGTKFINRAGRNLGARDRKRLDAAKAELRIAFGREPKGRGRRAA